METKAARTEASTGTQAHPATMAFTLIELLVVIAIIGILAGLLLPVLNRAKQKGTGAQCLNNVRQLTLGWHLYTTDHEGKLINNYDSRDGSWVLGNLDFSDLNSINTEPRTLIDDEFVRGPAGHNSQSNLTLGAYVSRSTAIFKCPGDKSRVAGGARVRSVSMNQAVGYNAIGPWLDGPPRNPAGTQLYRTYKVESDMVAPSPSGLFIFIDEHPDQINDGGFAVVMQTNAASKTGYMIDYPANYHNGSSALSFADGHVEMHRWVNKDTLAPITYSDNHPKKIDTMPVDAYWLSSRASAPR
jgi:prepilin-type N-terminal cleavage/methylation domain-containing protein/prepilin-type processing-associated H-X9-DG protein